jgi:mannose-6-phosphate isomerase-like protein (cupin superfamily)
LGADAKGEVWIQEGCYILELLNDPADPEVSVARARVEPGETTKWHHLVGTSERYLIQSGIGDAWVGEQPPRRVESGDVVLIPPMTRQRIHNPGPDDLVFLVICTPRFLPENYEEPPDQQD